MTRNQNNGEIANLKRLSGQGRDKDTLAAAAEITAWYRAMRTALDESPDFSPEEKAAGRLEIMLEAGRRYKKAEARARRQNTPAKLLERQALAEIADEQRRSR